MDHNSMDPNPKYATARWDSLAKTFKIVINHNFVMKNMMKPEKLLQIEYMKHLNKSLVIQNQEHQGLPNQELLEWKEKSKKIKK